MYVLVGIAVVLVFVLLFAAGVRAIVRRADARASGAQDTGGPGPDSGRSERDGADEGSADASGGSHGRNWQRVVECTDGHIEVRAGESAGRDEAGHVCYAIEVHRADGVRALEAVVEDWIADEVVASPEGDRLAFVREDEERPGQWGTRAHVVELDQGRVVCSVELPGRHRAVRFETPPEGRRITLETDRETRSIDLPAA